MTKIRTSNNASITPVFNEDAELRYPAIDAEALAVVEGVRAFDP